MAREKRAQLMADYQDKLRLVKPDYPEMVQLRAQIAEYDRQIKSQAELVKHSIKSQFEAARRAGSLLVSKEDRAAEGRGARFAQSQHPI